MQTVAALQAVCPDAAQWPVADYLSYEFTVAIAGGAVAGFLVWRTLAEGECEVLNLAVSAAHRRKGVARALLAPLLNLRNNDVFLEVRESNAGARIFYKSMGFQELSVRREYYESPRESGIVMKFHSC